jgi:O-antigen ligase
VFAVSLNLLFYFNHVVSVKKLVISNFIVFFVISLFAFSFSSSIQSSIQQTNSHQRSTEGRLEQWKQTLDAINKYPFGGTGSKNYALVGSQTQSVDLEKSFIGRVNNTYLQLAIEKGWIGLLLWLFVIGYFIFHSFKQIKSAKKRIDKVIKCVILSAIIAILFREFFFCSLFYNSGILFLFCILLLFSKEDDIIISVPKWASAVVIVLSVISTVYLYLYVNRSNNNALFYATKGLECERSIENEFEYSYFNKDLILKNQNCKMITDAIQFYQKTCQLCPFDALFQHNLGWLYRMNLQTDSAMIYLSRAVKLANG